MYRVEKESKGKTAIVIDGWGQGIGSSPYTGLNALSTVDLSTPGEVSVGYPLTLSTTSGATLGNPIADSTRFFAYGAPGVPVGSAQSFAILDDAGQVFEASSITGTWNYLASNSTTTGANATDSLTYWLGYLFKTRGANIDYWNGSTWVNGWGSITLNATAPHFMYVGSDNVLYITNNNYLASVSLTDPIHPTLFNPADGSTYAFAGDKLQLPVTDVALSIAEVGGGSTGNSTLLIGGSQNAIYPWDKRSITFTLPIYVGDAYIKRLVSVNQNAFIFPGNQQGRGRIYITNGSQADLYFKIPDFLFGVQDPYFVWGDAIFHRNNLLIGFFVTANGGSVVGTAEVWAIDLDTKAFRSISSLTTNTGAASATALISTVSLSSPGFGYIVGSSDNGTHPHIAYSNTTVGTGTAGITTDLIPIGTFLVPQTLSQVEFKLRTALQSGESLTITPVSNLAVGTVHTFNTANTTFSNYFAVDFEKSQWVQFLITLNGNSNSSGVRLKELRIR